MIADKVFGVFLQVYSVFKSGRLSANIKLTLHKVLVRSKMNYACPAWEFVADTYLTRLHRLQNKSLCTTGNFSRCTPIREFHLAFRIPLCMILLRNHAGSRQNPYKIRKRQGEDIHRQYKGFTLGGGQAYVD
jgi:hypothetical protein